MAHYTFLERRHPEVTKNSCYVVSPVGSPKKVSVHGQVRSVVPTFSICTPFLHSHG